MSGIASNFTIAGTNNFTGAMSGIRSSLNFAPFPANPVVSDICGILIEGTTLGGTITEHKGLCIPELANAAGFTAIADQYGILLGDVKWAPAGHNWSIFSLGGNMAHVGNMRLGDTTVPEYNLEVAGVVKSESGRIKIPSRYTTTQTLDETDYEVFCNTDGGAWTVSLPAGVEGTQYRIINSGSSGNLLTITPNGAEHLIGVNSNYFRKDGETLIITYNATDGWY
jgi:hypothetical protein